MEEVSDNGFPVTVEEAKEGVAQSIGLRDNSYNSDFLSAMQTMGVSFSKIIRPRRID